MWYKVSSKGIDRLKSLENLVKFIPFDIRVAMLEANIHHCYTFCCIIELHKNKFVSQSVNHCWIRIKFAKYRIEIKEFKPWKHD